MTRLTWGGTDQRKYEAGVDRGVFYSEISPGVVWNGLISVEETFIEGDVSPFYFDGVKYVDLASTKTFQATVTAFSSPNGFAETQGNHPVVPGFILTRQSRKRFGFSYRTMNGDTDYKIHLVYNVLASPSGRAYASLNESAEVSPLSWVFDATPPSSSTFRPSAHFIIDSSKVDPEALAVIELILYGSDEAAPRLIALEELLDLLVDWAPLIIVPDSIGGLADLAPGFGDLYRTSSPGLLRALPTPRLYPASTYGFYRLE